MIPLGIYTILILLFIFIIFLRIEKIQHQKNINAIPIRIWVNGTRGKSSVTRLIGAGLRAGGKKVIAKTTGTKARFIIKNDFEIPVLRLGKANIKEQISIIKMAAKEKPDAVVIECMALRPDLQWTESMEIVRPTAVVITNIRADHLDVMGPTTKDIATTFINAAPRNCRILTTRTNIFDDLDKKIRNKNLKIYDVIGRVLIKFNEPTNNLVWQCNDNINRKVPNGIYWIVGETAEQRLIKKVVIYY